MSGTYSAQVINVNNNFQSRHCYLSATIALAQWVDDSVIIFDNDENVIYCNNRFGSFNDANKKDRSTLNCMCRFLAGLNIYKDIHLLHGTVKQAYRDLMPAFVDCELSSGKLVKFKIIPVLEKYNLTGMVMIGCLRNDRWTEIRSERSERLQL